MAEEFRKDWLPLPSKDPGGCVVPAFLTISEAMIRIAIGALPASGSIDRVWRTGARSVAGGKIPSDWIALAREN
jgi:hypothetical protein